MKPSETDRYKAPALDKGLDIIELLSGLDGGLTQAEIARQMGRNPNEFYRMLDTLVKRGYVARLEGDRYCLTLKLFGLGQLHAPVRRLAAYATPLMRELATASRQANQLVVFDRGSAVVIAQQEAPGYWGISIRVGSHLSLFDTGSGHVLLAFQTPGERLAMLSQAEMTHSLPVDGQLDFFDRLDRIQKRGYEKMASVQTAGVVNLSAPVLAADGSAIAALTVPFITLINTPAPTIAETIRLLQETAQALSRTAGLNVGLSRTTEGEPL